MKIVQRIVCPMAGLLALGLSAATVTAGDKVPVTTAVHVQHSDAQLLGTARADTGVPVEQVRWRRGYVRGGYYGGGYYGGGYRRGYYSGGYYAPSYGGYYYSAPSYYAYPSYGYSSYGYGYPATGVYGTYYGPRAGISIGFGSPGYYYGW